jgi:hypothetical protein
MINGKLLPMRKGAPWGHPLEISSGVDLEVFAIDGKIVSGFNRLLLSKQLLLT